MATFKKATIIREDFKTSNYNSNSDCLIARALKRAGAAKIAVGGYDYRYSINGKKFNVYITSKLNDVIDKWHLTRKHPNSFTFQVPVA